MDGQPNQRTKFDTKKELKKALDAYEDEEDDPFLSFKPDGEPNIHGLMAELENGDAETRSQAVVALAMSGELAAVEPLIATLKTHSNPEVRWGAIQALWRLGDMRALEPLIATLKGDEQSHIRRVAAYALGQLKDERAIEPLIAAFSDEIKGVGVTASLALAELGAAAARPLVALLYQGDEHSDEVERALQMMNDNEAIHPLLALLKEPDSRLRAYGALFLMHFDDGRVIEPLRSALQDPDSWVRHYARLSLDMLRGVGSYEVPRLGGQ